MIQAVIVDIDGTLADCSHRRHFVEAKPKDWKSFYAGMADDVPNKVVAAFVDRYYYYSRDVILVTGRPEDHRFETEKWLRKHGIPYDELFMRRSGDYRPDTEVKREIYVEQIKPNWRVELALDDRTSVVKVWRDLGIQCWQVAEGDF